jgi:hypothetical protein
MREIKTRADLYIAAGNSIKMQESAGIIQVCKAGGVIREIKNMMWNLYPHLYEFPLAVVEGKAVFVGDELYHSDGYGPCIVDSTWNPRGNFDAYSWNPPKPATVMVEMRREDAEKIAYLLEFQSSNRAARDAIKIALGAKK